MELTVETLGNFNKVGIILAYMKGQQIQRASWCCENEYISHVWSDYDGSDWNWDEYEYRIAEDQEKVLVNKLIQYDNLVRHHNSTSHPEVKAFYNYTCLRNHDFWKKTRTLQ